MSKPRIQVKTRVNFRQWNLDDRRIIAVLLDVHPRTDGLIRFYDTGGFWDEKPKSIILDASHTIGPNIYADVALQMKAMGYMFTAIKKTI